MELTGSYTDINDRRLYIWIIRDITRRRLLERRLALSQKMESVGQLAAGIAHEINTPIQYIGDNVRFFQDVFENLEQVFQRMETLTDAAAGVPQLADMAIEVREFLSQIDLTFIREEVPEAVAQTLEGTQRVASIVAAMKEFSHPGNQERAAVDLNRAIDSTLRVSRNEWKYVAQVDLDLQHDLPRVLCLPADLNQALLNLIVNASHAVGDRHRDSGAGSIRVSTRQVNQRQVEIRIADNGSGIPPHAVSKIFDPFFTTKPIGKGTGQGLAIVYNVIVEKHGGEIDVLSEPGTGTTFVVRLPIRGKIAPPRIVQLNVGAKRPAPTSETPATTPSELDVFARLERAKQQ